MVWGWFSASTTAIPPFERAGYSRGQYGNTGSYPAGDGYGGGGSGYNLGSYTGGSYSQGSGGYSGGGLHSGGLLESLNVLKSTDNSAALSALTLLGFLFFLNMLQSQLLSSGSQTLLFTVGGTGTGTGNGTFFGRRRRRDAGKEIWGLNFDLKSDEFQRHLIEKFWVNEEDPEVVGADSGAGTTQKPMSTPMVSPSLSPRNTEVDLAALPLPSHLQGVFSKCRDVVECAVLHQAPAITLADGQPSDRDEMAACVRSLQRHGARPTECDELIRTIVNSQRSDPVKHD